MKFLSVLVLAVAFGASSVEAGCRSGLLGGKIRGSTCGATFSKTKCESKIISRNRSCASSGCSATSAKSGTEVKPALVGPKSTAPSTK